MGSLPQTPTIAVDDDRPLLTTSVHSLKLHRELPWDVPIICRHKYATIYCAICDGNDGMRAFPDERSSGVMCVKLESVNNGSP